MSKKDWDLRLDDDVDDNIRSAAFRGLKLSGEYVLGESLKIVPIEEGTLMRSGTVSSDRSAMKVALSFDGPYCVYQHERMDLKHDPGRQAKYLEQPLNESHAEIRAIIAASIRGEL